MRGRRDVRSLPDEGGQATVLIIGCVFVLGLALALVVNASAAYLQRQSLVSLADGAALHGVDAGVSGAYAGGLDAGRLALDEELVRRAVRLYLVNSEAHRRYPGVTHRVTVGADSAVTVELEAPLELPLRIPGAPSRAIVGASARAAVTVVE